MAPINGLSPEERRKAMQEIVYADDGFWHDPTLQVYDYLRLAWVEKDNILELNPYLPDMRSGPRKRSEPVAVRYPSPTRVEIEATLDRPGLVILADVYYPGWTLTIDGTPAPIYQVNRLMRGAAVKEGKHQLVYTYSPGSFRAGRLASLSSFGILALLAVLFSLRPVDPIVGPQPEPTPDEVLPMHERGRHRLAIVLFLVMVLGPALACRAQTDKQPKVAPGANEPDWSAILKDHYGLSMSTDLLNPVKTTVEATPGLFRKAGPGPVRFAPVIALGLETRNRGGWYAATATPDAIPKKTELWSYIFKNTAEDLRTGKNLPPPLRKARSTEFEPGNESFGLWISNDGLNDGGVFSQPTLVAKVNKRLERQPYKAMIYPYRDKSSGKVIPNSYLIGWEYSTNDDFQDVVCRVDNVVLMDESAAKK